MIISESCEAGKTFFRDLYLGLGLRVFEDNFDGHDRTVAYSLATPFASTLVFAACMKRLDAPGTNFRKHLEIARSPCWARTTGSWRRSCSTRTRCAR